ncbi:response regulator [Paenibacillus gorillae]|uniref:response regulator n=1 Tax=Paenibacillus gorillae TaxID=1243662 RepID=UPI0004B54A66|nr:response regulator [Paenibacillus gorillae]
MKLLIVDDEVIIRTGLSTVIKWEELGYELLRPAASAEEALERMVLERPDIILTDIRMTGRDGLELAGEARRLLPDSEVLILTGYDQFSYAQQAIRQGVSDYLLKTSRPDEIVRAVNGAKQRVLGRLHTLKPDQLRDSLLEKLVAGPEPDRRQLEQAERLLPRLRLKLNAASPLQAVAVTASGWGGAAEDGKLLLFAVHNMMRELVEGEALIRDNTLLVVLRRDGLLADEGGLKRFESDMLRIEQRLKCKLFAGAGSIASDWRGLPLSNKEAVITLDFKEFASETRLLCYADVMERKGGRTVCTIEEEQLLTSLLKEGNPSSLQRWVEMTMVALLADPDVTPQSMRAFVNSVLISAHRWIERVTASFGESNGMHAGLPQISDQDVIRDDQRAQLLATLNHLMHVYAEAVGNAGIPYINRSIAYIHDHLDKELTLQQVARNVHLNPNHFSEVFKRETGHTYIEFVTIARIERAKALLSDSPIKVSDVASRVGYADMKYFSQLFKRYTGFTPSEYRARS